MHLAERDDYTYGARSALGVRTHRKLPPYGAIGGCGHPPYGIIAVGFVLP